MNDAVGSRFREALKIIGFATLAAIAYGIIHDLITAHVCVEYFTVGHPPVFATENPVLLALGWGVIATWWVGLPLGILLALAALTGPRPIGLKRLRTGIVRLMVFSGAIALISGLTGRYFGLKGEFPLTENWNLLLEPSAMVPFAFDAWVHSASYAAGFLGGLILIAHTIVSRVWAGTK